LYTTHTKTLDNEVELVSFWLSFKQRLAGGHLAGDTTNCPHIHWALHTHTHAPTSTTSTYNRTHNFLTITDLYAGMVSFRNGLVLEDRQHCDSNSWNRYSCYYFL